MKVVSLFVPGEPLDAFLYSGHLWVVGRDRVLRALAVKSLVSQLSNRHPQHAVAYQLAFERNDWLSNVQAQSLFAGLGFRRPLEKAWRSAAKQRLVAEDVSGWREITELPLIHFQDCRFYAMTAYFAGREGVFEAGLQVNKRQDEVGVNGRFVRVFDAPVLGLSAKAGEIVMSAGMDGLFHGTVGFGGARLAVDERRISARSTRTTWAGWDIVNYSGQRDFEYLRNEFERLPTGERRRFRFSESDETNERVRITSFATSTYGAEELGVTQWGEWSNAVFAQATGQTCVIVMNDNTCLWLNWKLDRDCRPYLGRRRSTLPRVGAARLGSPVSMSPLSTGFVLEYFDRVYLVDQSRSTLLEDRPALAVRTFLSSRRFRQIVVIVRQDGIALHAVLPGHFGQTAEETQSGELGHRRGIFRT